MALLAQDLDIDAVTFGKDRINKKGGKNVPIQLNGDNLQIQTPVRMRVPFEVQIDENDSGMKKYSIQLSLGGSEGAEEFRAKLEELDVKIRGEVSARSQTWWGKSISEEVIESADMAKPMVRQSKNGMYDPTLKIKLPIYSNGPTWEAYSSETDSEGHPKEIQFYKDGAPDMSFIRAGTRITALIECDGLWVIQKNVYCTWKVTQMKVYKAGARISGYAIQDDDPEEDGSDFEEEED